MPSTRGQANSEADIPESLVVMDRVRAETSPGVWVGAAVAFAFTLGFADLADSTSARVVLGLASASMAATVWLLGQSWAALRDHRRFRFLETWRPLDALAEQKQQILDALKEIDFDHAMGKLNAADHEVLRHRYRSEAIRILHAIDQERARWRARAEDEARGFLTEQGLTPTWEHEADAPVAQKTETTPERAPQATPNAPDDTPAAEAARPTCPSCETENDPDARFCKSCGQALDGDEA